MREFSENVPSSWAAARVGQVRFQFLVTKWFAAPSIYRIASTGAQVVPHFGQKNKSAYLFTSSRGEKTASKIKSAYLFTACKGETTASKKKSAYLCTALEGSTSTPKLKSAYLCTTFKSEKNTNVRKVQKMNKKN